MKRVLLILVLGLFLVNYVSAINYYVSPDGTETWPNCTAENNTCRASSIDKAFLGAVAGDTVYFLDGIYSGLTQADESQYRTPTWYALNSGTAGNPITFKALNQGQVHLIGLGINTINSKIIGSSAIFNEQYIVWDGFVLSAVNSDGDPIMAAVNIYYSDYITVQNCEIIGASHNTGGAINYEGVRIEGSDYTTVKNCKIHGFNELDHNHNTGGLKTYDSYYANISNNNFYDNNYHLYIKGYGNGHFDIGHNFFLDGDSGILNTLNSGDNFGHVYHNNLFVNMIGALGDGGAHSFYQDDAIIRDNTFYSNITGNSFSYVSSTNTGHAGSIYNNIFYSIISNRDIITRPSISELKEADHNLYYSGLYILLSRYSSERTYSTLTDWQSSGELEFDFDAGCGSNQNPGCGSIVSDPKFLNPSGAMSEIEDFRLAPDSPCVGAGRDGEDMGADIDLVGVQSVGVVDSDCADNDSDGYGVGVDCLGLDCDDNDSLVWAELNCSYNGTSCGSFSVCGSCLVVPEEVCGNGVDEDCDGEDLVCVCVHDADLVPCDGVVSTEELGEYIGLWLVGGVSIGEVMSAINAWSI